MGSTSDETRYDHLVKRLRNNRFIVGALIMLVVLTGAGAATGALQSTWDFIEVRLFGRSAELRREYCELLRPLVIELDRTEAAFNRWNQKDLSLESETIRDGNLNTRALLREKGHLVPASLQEDQKKLISHYDEWIEEYDRVRVRKTRNPQQPFVFVYSFPKESAQRFKDRMVRVGAQLGEGGCK